MNAEPAATRYFAVEPEEGQIVAVVHLAADLVAVHCGVGEIRPQFRHDRKAGVDIGVAGREGDGEFLSVHGGHVPPVCYPACLLSGGVSGLAWDTVCQIPGNPQAPSLACVVGEDVGGEVVLHRSHPGDGFGGDGQGAALFVVPHGAPELNGTAPDDDVDAVVVDPGLGAQQVVQLGADLVIVSIVG